MDGRLGAFANLHTAEVMLAELLSDDEIEVRIPEALVRLQRLDETDLRRRKAEAHLCDGKADAGWRAWFTYSLRIGFACKDEKHARVRSFRNILVGTTLALTGLVSLLCIIGATYPDAIPLCFQPGATTLTQAQVQVPPAGEQHPGSACPSEDQPPSPNDDPRLLPARGDVALVALFGFLGAGLSAAIAVRNLEGSSTPYGVPIALSLLKLPSGALAAIVGLLLVRGEFIPGLSQLDNQPQILAYAFIFGIAQQAATRLVDRQAQEILGSVPSKEPALSQGNTPPAPTSPAVGGQ